MADHSPETIVCRFDPQAGQWVSHFKRSPHVEFGGDGPFGALNRLLEGTEAEPGEYIMQWDQGDRTGAEALFWTVTWQPPELLHECPDCGGTGRYAGVTDMEFCQTCGGRKVIRV
jgi:hypothetical protein